MGDRKARLAALASKAGRAKVPDGSTDDHEQDGDDEEASGSEKKSQSVSFRNYAPKDKDLGGEGLGNDDGEGPETKRQRVEEEPTRSTSSALHEALKEAKDDVTSMILQGKSSRDAIATPKKLNWDLKRDIQDKLNKLEKRTQKALVEMLKERLENEATEQANSEDSNLD